MVVNLEQHCCLADLGIRRSTLPLGIVANGGEVGGDGDGDDDDGGAGEILAGRNGDTLAGAGGLGGLPEPGHLADNGP